MEDQKQPVAFSPEDMKRRKRRSIVMALCLVALIILFFITTIVNMGAHLADRVI